jgi:hypothetical protein
MKLLLEQLSTSCDACYFYSGGSTFESCQGTGSLSEFSFPFLWPCMKISAENLVHIRQSLLNTFQFTVDQ